jgi:hypothetical protein
MVAQRRAVRQLRWKLRELENGLTTADDEERARQLVAAWRDLAHQQHLAAMHAIREH